MQGDEINWRGNDDKMDGDGMRVGRKQKACLKRDCLEESKTFWKTLLQMDLHKRQDTVTPPTVALNFALIFIVLKSHCVGVMSTDMEFGSRHREVWITESRYNITF